MNWNKKYYPKTLEYKRNHREKVKEWNRRYYLARKKKQQEAKQHG